MSIDDGHLAAVPIREIHRTVVTNHRVIELVLRDGATLHQRGAPDGGWSLFRAASSR
jgi:hypothetical protein